jgi:hypothetical protein
VLTPRIEVSPLCWRGRLQTAHSFGAPRILIRIGTVSVFGFVHQLIGRFCYYFCTRLNSELHCPLPSVDAKVPGRSFSMTQQCLSVSSFNS